MSSSICILYTVLAFKRRKKKNNTTFPHLRLHGNLNVPHHNMQPSQHFSFILKHFSDNVPHVACNTYIFFFTFSIVIINPCFFLSWTSSLPYCSPLLSPPLPSLLVPGTQIHSHAHMFTSEVEEEVFESLFVFMFCICSKLVQH